MNNMINDWAPETRSLLNALLAGGCVPVKGDNGEEKFNFEAAKLGEFIDNLTACDESRLYVTCPDGKTRWIYLVLGNSPGEIASDWSCPAEGTDHIDPIVSAHYDKWSERKQPMKASPY